MAQCMRSPTRGRVTHVYTDTKATTTMAARERIVKRGRPTTKTECERKKDKKERDKALAKSRINIGDEFQRWENVRLKLNVKQQRDVAKTLLDMYCSSPSTEKKNLHHASSKPVHQEKAQKSFREVDSHPSPDEVSSAKKPRLQNNSENSDVTHEHSQESCSSTDSGDEQETLLESVETSCSQNLQESEKTSSTQNSKDEATYSNQKSQKNLDNPKCQDTSVGSDVVCVVCGSKGTHKLLYDTDNHTYAVFQLVASQIGQDVEKSLGTSICSLCEAALCRLEELSKEMHCLENKLLDRIHIVGNTDLSRFNNLFAKFLQRKCVQICKSLLKHHMEGYMVFLDPREDRKVVCVGTPQGRQFISENRENLKKFEAHCRTAKKGSDKPRDTTAFPDISNESTKSLASDTQKTPLQTIPYLQIPTSSSIPYQQIPTLQTPSTNTMGPFLINSGGYARFQQLGGLQTLNVCGPSSGNTGTFVMPIALATNQLSATVILPSVVTPMSDQQNNHLAFQQPLVAVNNSTLVQATSDSSSTLLSQGNVIQEAPSVPLYKTCSSFQKVSEMDITHSSSTPYSTEPSKTVNPASTLTETHVHTFNPASTLTETQVHAFNPASTLTKTQVHAFNPASTLTETPVHAFNPASTLTKTQVHAFNPASTLTETPVHTFNPASGLPFKHSNVDSSSSQEKTKPATDDVSASEQSVASLNKQTEPIETFLVPVKSEPIWDPNGFVTDINTSFPEKINIVWDPNTSMADMNTSVQMNTKCESTDTLCVKQEVDIEHQSDPSLPIADGVCSKAEQMICVKSEDVPSHNVCDDNSQRSIQQHTVSPNPLPVLLVSTLHSK